MAEQLKVLNAKTDNRSLIPGTHIVGGSPVPKLSRLAQECHGMLNDGN